MYKIIFLCLLVQMAYCSYPITKDSCSESEYYVKCTPICEPRCNVPTPPNCGSRGMMPPTKWCFPGCICRFGYYRNSENKCVILPQCS